MQRKDAGFSLIEALTAMAVVAIVLAIGVPSFADALRRQRVATTLYLLSADVAMARSTALMRRAQVVVCPREVSTARCAETQDWSRGWMSFVDDDGNRQPGTEADILRISDAPAPTVLFLPSSRPFLRYQRDGRAANSNLTIYLCEDAEYAGMVVVNNLGRVRTERAPATGKPCPRD